MGFEVIEISERILERAEGSFPLAVSTLDAIHLASALLFKEEIKQSVTLLTHDPQLARVARVSDLKVTGAKIL